MIATRVVPILRIFDFELAKRFYVDWLRMNLDWVHQFDGQGPRYIQVSRGNLVLHLSEHWGDCTPGARVYIEIDDAAALHKELHNPPNPNMRPGIETTPWNTRCIDVVDPFGNRLSFNEPREGA